jgi:4-amino-4-deoxy-L-arabinose transferase-like glycosyltransferase
MLELAIGPYAVGRFVPVVKHSQKARSTTRTEQGGVAGTQSSSGQRKTIDARIRSAFSRHVVRSPAGPLRLADGQLAAQVGWLFPLAVMGLVMAIFRGRFRIPLTATHLALLLWLGWAFTYGIVYSFAGGIMHLYYLATLGPPLAALAAIGVVNLWDLSLQRGRGAVLLPITLLMTAAWQLYVQASALGWKLDETTNWMAAITALRAGFGNWLTWIHVALLAGTLVAAGGFIVLLCLRDWGRPGRGLAAGALGMGLLALLLVPMAWALSSVLVAGHGVLPSADLARLNTDGNASAGLRGRFLKLIGSSKLVRFLKANHRGERYLLATSTTWLAAPIIISTGQAVMARGGFHGLDPILSTEKLAQMVRTNQIRFVMLGDLPVISRTLGAEVAGKPIAEWVQANGKLVDSTLWRSYGGRRSSAELYDLRPEVALVSAP